MDRNVLEKVVEPTGLISFHDNLEAAISEALIESSRHKICTSPLVEQQLIVPPEANIICSVPDNLDLYYIINEIESEESDGSEDKEIVASGNKSTKEKDIDHIDSITKQETESVKVTEENIKITPEKFNSITKQVMENAMANEENIKITSEKFNSTIKQEMENVLVSEGNMKITPEKVISTTKQEIENTMPTDENMKITSEEFNSTIKQMENAVITEGNMNITSEKLNSINKQELENTVVTEINMKITQETFNSITNQEMENAKGTEMYSSFTSEDFITNEEECQIVGGSKFYDVIDDTDSEDSASSPSEKQDGMKPIVSDNEVSDVDQECTVFSGVCYLGSGNITDPKSESEIQTIMKELSSMPESSEAMAVSISIPICSQGLVVLYEADTNVVMALYRVNRISFYARGTECSPVASCFAFTWSHGQTKETSMCKCHVFRCAIAEAVTQVSACFAKAFERIPPSMASSIAGELSAAPSISGSLIEGVPLVPSMQLMQVLECTLDIKEIDYKRKAKSVDTFIIRDPKTSKAGAMCQVPKERFGYKIRSGVDKQVTIQVQQVSKKSQTETSKFYTGGLIIERCFGILLAPGRDVKHSDMRLLEIVSGSSEGAQCSMCALWNASESSLSPFNIVNGEQGSPDYMSLAFDLVIKGIPDPLRLVMETPVKVYPSTERFWYFQKRSHIQQFFINLKEGVDAAGQPQYEVVSVETTGELDRSLLNLPSLTSFLQSPGSTAPGPASPTEPDSDGDEPLLSGTGQVSKDCGIDMLENWNQVLRSWVDQRPRSLTSLVRLGVPEALRCEVWLRLANVDQNDKLMETYRTLISKECSFESVIQRDIARTFPAHDFFKEAGGLGQDSLLRMARVYAVYDKEVGYCQGLSFLAATLLLHMPEEQAFCLLVRLMYDYSLRDLYKDGFEALYMRLHQLDRLMEEHMNDLRTHFQQLGVEPHMYASQWFLTVFTARFPLPLVYHILDIFLLQGVDTLFQVALALLQRSKKDLLLLDFEGVLKYFRVTLPKKCRAEDAPRQITKLACSLKVKRLPKYQSEYEKFVKESAEKEKLNVELERLKAANTQLQLDNDLYATQFTELMTKYQEATKEATSRVTIANDYRAICARQDKQLYLLQVCMCFGGHAKPSVPVSSTTPMMKSLLDITETAYNSDGLTTCYAKDIAKECPTCSGKLALRDNKKSEKEQIEAQKATDGEVMRLKERIRELELELADAKLLGVQAECRSQELAHQLNSAMNEIQTTENQKQSVTPWLARTLGSIMEAAQNRPSFQTYLPHLNAHESSPPLRRQSSGSTHSQTQSLDRRISEPNNSELRKKGDSKRQSLQAPSNKEAESQKDMNRRSHDVTSMVKNLSMG